MLLFIIFLPLCGVVSSLQAQGTQRDFVETTTKFIFMNAVLAIFLFFSTNFWNVFFVGQISDFRFNHVLSSIDVLNSDYLHLYLSLWSSIQTESFFLLQQFGLENVIGTWIESGFLNIEWTFSANSLNTIMLIVVNLISSMVHMYSLDYMSHDRKIGKFFSYLSLFTFFMILLITGDNLIILFLGWEGVGLCSYLLISFWNKRVQANKAAIKALVVNRIADLALTVGIILIFFIFNSLSFDLIFSLICDSNIFITELDLLNNKTENFFFDTILYYVFDSNTISINSLSLIAFLLFFGAMGKSAQIGLHTWLPDAMEGPTPVSALIHAATMVTAGVFLIIRCSFLFEQVPNMLIAITFIGSLTALLAATIGLVQNDIKKVVAYSTCSQLGYMIFACGLSNYHIAFFHLVNHAFFKALLFLSAGAVIHSISNEQDMRKYGGLLQIIPFTTSMLFIGSIALMGFPFFTGFYSKDLILEVAYSKFTVSSFSSYIFGVLAAFCTAFYSYKVFFVTYFLPNTTHQVSIKKAHELPIKMAIVLFTLAIFSVFFGYFAKELFVGLGSDFFKDSIYILSKNNSQLAAEFIPHIIKLIPLFLSMIAILCVNFFFSSNRLNFSVGQYNFSEIYRFFIFKWYFDWMYNKFINKNIVQSSLYIFKNEDKQILEWFGPTGISSLINFLLSSFKKLQTGNIQHYSFLMIISLFFFLYQIQNLC